MDKLLSDEIQKSREHLARLRALRKPKDYPMIDTSEKVSDILQEPQTIPELALLEEPKLAGDIPPPVHIQELDTNGAVIDLAEQHNITAEVCNTIGEIMESTKEDEYEKKELLDALEKGMIVNLGIQGYSYFRILKVCSTETKKDLFIVNFKEKNSKPAKTTLILNFQFPLKKGTCIEVFSSGGEKKFKPCIVDSIEINTKLMSLILSTLRKIKSI